MDRLTIFILCLVSVLAVSDARHMPRKQIGNNGKLSVRNEFKTSANMSAVEALDEELMEIVKLCNTTFPTPPEYLTQLNETGRFPLDASHNAKCYLHCLFSNLKIVDEKGKLNSTDVGKLFTPEEEEFMQSDFVKKCLTEEEQNRDACEQTYERISCLIKERIDYCSDKSDRM